MNKNYPKIRFSEFEKAFEENGGEQNSENPYAWEQRKLGEVFDFSVSTNSLSRSQLNYDKGEIKNVHYGDILVNYGSILDVETDKIPFITDGLLDKYKPNLLKNGDVIFADAAEDDTVGKAVEVNGLSDKNLVSGLHTIVARPMEKMADFFIGYYINSNIYHSQLLKLMQGTKVSSISKINLKKTIVSYPENLDEQKKIGGYLRLLDTTITLHQRKLKTLEKMKKSYLQKLFPKNGEQNPEIRFTEFKKLFEENGGGQNSENPYAWEQRKLKDIVNRVTRKNKNLESTLPLTISAQYGLVDQITFFNKQIASKDVSGYYLLQKGEFAYNKSYSKDFPWGAIKRLDMYDEGVLSTLYIAFRPFKVNSDFLVSYYETDGWHKEVAIRAAEGARNHGLLNITAVDFFDTGLLIPPNNDEQQEIGGFFIELDHTITLHQRKLKALQDMKKSLLQKMFI
ncbi:restriction endonuclease subunit S [Pseudolactococcus reticulitermitis]|uniref:Type I restriction modification DNA specificity domain-containing protein n=1 Tax=Pseudolactococcus reticulitermitis TaxID=2025039 RepID=A0A224XBF8_9LACT|nr:restriction endonuclease subunit S [Lactococcus reticulitermitis]GAX47035.1 hypothetical protein RsY01_616 [Lactococcus reticulitermitis]